MALGKTAAAVALVSAVPSCKAGKSALSCSAKDFVLKEDGVTTVFAKGPRGLPLQGI